jgi:hypothetical protein
VETFITFWEFQPELGANDLSAICCKHCEFHVLQVATKNWFVAFVALCFFPLCICICIYTYVCWLASPHMLCICACITPRGLVLCVYMLTGMFVHVMYLCMYWAGCVVHSVVLSHLTCFGFKDGNGYRYPMFSCFCVSWWRGVMVMVRCRLCRL